MMERKSLLREMLCGLLLGLLILPAQPAQAFPVFDAPAHAQRIKSELNRLREWTEKIRQYQQLYQNAVQQYTTLRGVLQTVDRQLAKNMQLAHLTNDIGEIIRGASRTKRQVENMVRYQIDSLQRIDDRLKNGIFDPEQDIRDLEEYLMYSMGRNSRQTIQLAARTARADAQVSKWMTDRKLLAIDRAEAYKKLRGYQDKLEREKNNPDPLVIQPLHESIQQTQIQINALEKSIAELEEKLQQRINALGLKLSDMENFGYTIYATTQAWRELQTTKDEIAKTFDQMIQGTQPAP
jgi:chromosome segregation ATPase